MNVTCPECRSVFRVDPSKLPGITVRARCSVCGGIIGIAEGGGTSIEDEFASPSSSARDATSVARSPAQSASPPARGDSWRPQSTMQGALTGEAAKVAVGLETPARANVEAPKAPSSQPGPPSMPVSASPAAAASAPTIPSVSQPVRSEAPKAAPPPIAKPIQNRPVLFPPRPMMPGIAPAAGPNGIARPAPAPVRPLAQTPRSAPQIAPRSLAQPAPALAVAPNVGMSSATPPLQPNDPPSSIAAAEPPRAVAPAPQTPGTGAARAPINPFLANDPHAKAKRLARALVSDLVTYFPQKCEEGLRDGTLKQLFKDEIQKSHEEYVSQVGREFADSTPHFQDALNDILARGQKVF